MKGLKQGRILVEVPADGDHSLAEVCDSLESTLRQVDGVAIDTGWASISNNNVNATAVVGVDDVNAPSAKRGSNVCGTIAGDFHSSNEGTITVPVAASTGVTVLIEVGGEASGLFITTGAAAVVIVIVAAVSGVGSAAGGV